MRKMRTVKAVRCLYPHRMKHLCCLSDEHLCKIKHERVFIMKLLPNLQRLSDSGGLQKFMSNKTFDLSSLIQFGSQ